MDMKNKRGKPLFYYFASVSNFFLKIFSLEVNPKQPKDNKATALISESDGSIVKSVALFIIKEAHKLKPLIIPINLFEENCPLSA